MSTNDLQALFANLKPKSREPSSASAEPASQSVATFGQPKSPTPLSFSATNPAKMPNDAAASNTAGGNKKASANTQSLLNLLNFGSTTAPQQTSAETSNLLNRSLSSHAVQSEQSSHSTPVTALDLLSRMMIPPISASQTKQSLPVNADDKDSGAGTSGSFQTSDPSQDALLKLLSKTSISSAGRASSTERSRLPSGKQNTTVNTNGIKEALESRVTDAQTEPVATVQPKEEESRTKENKPLFTYTNPFEALNASRTQTPNATTPVPVPQSPIFKGLSEIPIQSVETPGNAHREVTPDYVARRKKLTPRLPSSAKFGQLSREGTMQSTGTPEPNAKQPSPEVKIESSPTRLNTDMSAVQVFKEDSAVPNPPAEEKPADVNAKDSANDEWEDANEDSPVVETAPREVPVYNFPIKPFVSITLQLNTPSPIGIREDGVMEISRLKKEFDQLDRSLCAATSKYISYALVKNGGMRIIRQDDGSDRQVFKNSHDRVFNVAFCTTTNTAPPSEHQAILGTGVSGSVYYATVCKDGNDLFEKNELDVESLVFAPWPPADENTAGGVLKTRAKRSSRHPEFFAIGRGKSIHLIWPATAMSPKYGIGEGTNRVDVEKLYQERNLQISTGKAGKDFIFSEDDSLVVSLDKTGRLRFWDIRELIDETNATSARVAPIVVDTPLLSLSTASPAEKSWPTSVLFVDKVRPYTKGGALRYVLVGLRQNHTLQLWDVALGKAVQELNFPHENETDGVCSVNYHPNSGIIVVGHPTRNSIFFIHLSAPRYTFSSSMSQAVYTQRIAAKDPEIPKPESTACMSGIREMSFAEKGHLRSVELLHLHKSTDAPKVVDEKTPLFELYVVHSKGVTCLNITKEDLGWNAESKVLHPIDASKEGFVTLKELKLGSVIEEPSRSPVEEIAQPSKSSKKKSKKTQQVTDRVDNDQAETEDLPPMNSTPQVPAPAPIPAPIESTSKAVNGETLAPKESKKSKKKAAQTTDLQPLPKPSSRTSSPTKTLDSSTTKPPTMDTTASTTNPSQAEEKSSENIAESKSESISVGISGDWLDKELKKIEHGVAAEFRKELNNLYSNIQNDRIVQDSSAAARQEAILRLVSTTLNTNVEKSLTRILGLQMQQIVVPSITGVTVQAVTAQVGEAVAKTLHQMIPHELNTQLPVAVNAALSNPQLSRAISETISHRIGKQTELALTEALNKHVIPTFKSLTMAAAEKAATDVEARLSAEMRQFEAQRQHDTTRLEKLAQLVQGMAETLQIMSDTQVSFQAQILKDRQQLVTLGEPKPESRQVSTARMTPSPAPIAPVAPVKPKTKEELELEEITTMMEEGRYEEGSIKWLQSSQPAELFDNLFIRFTPEYLSSDVSPLVAFSIAVTVGNSIEKNTARRLDWISASFDAVDIQDPEIADLSQHAPTLVASLIQKLESLYMTTAERNQNDPVLRQIPMVVKKAKDIRAGLLSAKGRGARF